MAIPTFVASSTGNTDAMGAFTGTCHAPGAAGRIIIFQVLQDGTNDGSTTLSSATNIENLAGTDNTWTAIGEFTTGASDEARHYAWIGRSLSTTAPTFTGGNSSGDDVYWIFHEFNTVSTGTTLATVIENVTAGGTTNSPGTGATASAPPIFTLGPDRLAVGLLGINDDNTPGEVTGESGGDWVKSGAGFRQSSGSDGAVDLYTAAMPNAGRLDGGTCSIVDSDAWGFIGFALIGTTATPDPHFKYGFTNFNDPGIV